MPERSLTRGQRAGENCRAASTRRRASLLITASITASFAAPQTARAEAPHVPSLARRLQAALVPRLTLGARVTHHTDPLIAAWVIEAWGALAWPLDLAAGRDEAALLRDGAWRAAAHARKAERRAGLEARRRAIAPSAHRSAEATLDLEELDAKLDALEDER